MTSSTDGDDSFVKAGMTDQNPLERASCLHRLLWLWPGPIIRLAALRTLSEADLWPLRKEEKSRDVATTIQQAWAKECAQHEDSSKRSLSGVVFRWARPTLAVTLLFKMGWLTAALLAHGVVLRELIRFFEGGRQEIWVGIVLTACFGLGELFRSVFVNQHWLNAMLMGTRLRGALRVMIYDKLLKLRNPRVAVGKVVNMSAADAQRAFDACQYGQFLVSTPVSLVVIIIFMAIIIGPSTLAGFAVLFLLAPVQTRFGAWYGSLRRATVKFSDKRIRLMSEALSGIRLLKQYGWEAAIASRVSEVRAQELAQLTTAAVVRAANFVITFATPVMVTLATLATHALVTGEAMAASDAFTVISLFNVARFPLGVVAIASRNLSEALVGLSRIQEFLEQPEVSDADLPGAILSEEGDATAADGDERDVVLQWRDAEYTWAGEEEEEEETAAAKAARPAAAEAAGMDLATTQRVDAVAQSQRTLDSSSPAAGAMSLGGVEVGAVGTMGSTLSGIALSVRRGELVAVTGPVGCGKTSLLASLTGQLRLLSGTAGISGRVALVAQNPWVFNASIRDNVLFGAEPDEERYRVALDASQLRQDLAEFPAGDATEVGESGISLSGGQKARVALARAVYSKADIVLLDSVLSAVDVHVGRKISEECIGGVLAGRTRLLATHHLGVLRACDRIVVMEGGKITACGAFEELEAAGVDLSAVVETGGDDAGSIAGGGEGTADETAVAGAGILAVDGSAPMGFAPAAASTAAAAADVAADRDGDDVEDSSVAGEPAGEADPGCIRLGVTPHPSFLPGTATAKAQVIADAAGTAVLARAAVDDVTGASSALPTDGTTPTPASGAGEVAVAAASGKGTGVTAVTVKPSGKLILAEDRAVGRVSCRTFTRYFVAAGGCWWAYLLLALLVLGRGSKIGSDSWVSEWSRAGSSGEANASNQGYYIGIYAATAAGVLALNMLLGLVFAVITLRASGVLHDRVFAAVMSAKTWWFDATPTGRILNRFSSDLDAIDVLLPQVLQTSLELMVQCALAVVVIAAALPWFLIPLVPLVVYMVTHVSSFRRAARDLKRLDGVSRSPLLSHLQSSVLGLNEIRAFGESPRYSSSNVLLTDNNTRAFFAFYSANRWLGFRLDLMTTVIAMLSSALLLVAGDGVSPGIAGLVMTYSLQMAGILQFSIRQSSEAEALFTSVERLSHYASDTPQEAIFAEGSLATSDAALQAEAAPASLPATPGAGPRGTGSSYSLPHVSPRVLALAPGWDPKSWPAQLSGWPWRGRIDVRDLVVGYRTSAEPVLKGVSFTLPAGSSMGVVGRTGSGKSTLLQSLFRMVDPSSGSILIDGVGIGSAPLQQLRSSLTLVPQDPTLFIGTVRHNLDPFDQFEDDACWHALERGAMADRIRAAGGLGAEVTEAGGNFSAGERQLLCLCRALLRDCRVLVLDEATSQTDSGTDAKVQEVVRSLHGVTLLVVAHRLETVMDSDVILVLDGGRVGEVGSPASLLGLAGTAQAKGSRGLLKAMVEGADEATAARLRAIALSASLDSHK